jgi:hypothetical protein
MTKTSFETIKSQKMKFQSQPSESGTYEFTIKFSFGAEPITEKTVDVAPEKIKISF